MQYAQILIKSKTTNLKQTFTYEIPPKILPYIQKGQLVMVPFGNRQLPGIIFNIVRHLNNIDKTKLKSITKIVHQIPVINEMQFALAQKISDYYLANYAQILFFMVPELSKKIIKKNANISKLLVKYSSNAVRSFNYRGANHGNQTLINFFSIYDKKVNRIKKYAQIIAKAFANHKSVILLFPDFMANKFLIDIILNKFSDKTIVFDPNIKSDALTKIWLRLKIEKPLLIIGTRNTIFQIPNNLGLIIIDELEHFGYKEEQTIHHHALKNAHFLAQITRANLIIGNNYPYENIVINNNKNLAANKFYLKTKLITIDAKSDPKFPLGYPIEQIIKNEIVKNKRVLIIAQEQGFSPGIICKDCKELFYCPRCNKLLRLRREADLNIYCPRCNFNINIPASCPKCHSNSLIPFGHSARTIAQKVGKLFANEKNIILENDDIFLKPDNENHIFIGTRYALSWANWVFDSVIILDAQNWQYQEVIAICAQTDKLYLQTPNIDDEDFNNIVSKRFELLAKNDLAQKLAYHYPPFYQVIKISFKDKNAKISQKQMAILAKEIIQILPKSFIEISDIIEGEKLRDKYYFFIIIKTKITNNDKLLNLLKKHYQALRLNHYLLDIDPIKLI